MQTAALSKPQNSAVLSLPKANRFTGKDAHAIAELLQQENPGLKFFHLQPNLKKPLAGSRGWEDCTDDLESLFDGVEFEGMGLAVVFGGQPYFALDVDTKKEHKGATNLCEFLGYVLPAKMSEAQAADFLIEKLDTLIARSPSGGLHIYFRHDHPFRVKMPKRPKGNDFRGPVGYLVAPGTHTKADADPSGNTFTGTYEVIKDRPIALAPQIILDSLVDIEAPVERASGAATGKPVTLEKFMGVIAHVDPDEGREKWIIRAGSFHNTNLVNEAGESLDAEKLELWLRFCRGEFWKGSKDSWINGMPSLYTGDGDAEVGFDSIGQKEGGADYGSLVHAARPNGYGLLIDDSYPDDLEAEAIKGLMENEPKFPKAQRVSNKPSPAADWTIQNKMIAGLPCLLFGDELAGKSFIAIHEAVDLAMDCVKFHGDKDKRGIEYRIRKHGAVIYFAAEGIEDIKKRARAAILARDPNIDPETVPLLIYDVAPMLANDHARADAIARMKLDLNGLPLTAFYVDTAQYAMSQGSSSNNGDDANLMWRGVKDITREIPGKAHGTLVRHVGHAEKARTSGSKDWENSSEIRYFAKCVKETTVLDSAGREAKMPIVTELQNQKLKGQSRGFIVYYTFDRVEWTAQEIDPDTGALVELKDSTLVARIITKEEAAFLTRSNLPPDGANDNGPDEKLAKLVEATRLVLDKADASEVVSLGEAAKRAISLELWIGKAETFKKALSRVLADEGEKYKLAREPLQGLYTTRVHSDKTFFELHGQGGRLEIWAGHAAREEKRTGHSASDDGDDF